MQYQYQLILSSSLTNDQWPMVMASTGLYGFLMEINRFEWFGWSKIPDLSSYALRV